MNPGRIGNKVIVETYDLKANKTSFIDCELLAWSTLENCPVAIVRTMDNKCQIAYLNHITFTDD